MNKPEPLPIRPYARLLTMLGEQLIKNERIALIELIKNAYDADSPWVKVSLIGFGDNFAILPDSKIVIEDAGHGMTEQIIRDHLVNPATPEKKRRKASKPTTESGRIIQGEKGIGRYAILKLGRKIDIVTRPIGGDKEYLVQYDFTPYDDEFLTKGGEEANLFLEDLSVGFSVRQPKEIITKEISLGARKLERGPHGTTITISELKGAWTEKKVQAVYQDVSKLESIFSERALKTERGDRSKKNTKNAPLPFQVEIYQDLERLNYHEAYIEKLNVLLDDRAVFQIEDGKFDSQKQQFSYNLNGIPHVLGLRDPALTGLRVFKDRFDNGGKVLDSREIECGPFNFAFYVFDFSSKAPPKYHVDKKEKELIKEHRIYLYRDDIRVYPYGEPDDDWLRIDAYRGTISAGAFLSNDQVVGYINISQENNPKLKDKTNREGLIDEGNATDDFIALIQSFLAYIREKPYNRYRKDIEKKSAQDVHHRNVVQEDLEQLKAAVKDSPKASKIIAKAEKSYNAERRFLMRRAETTEELAGVGLSVETASHDIMAIMEKAMIAIDGLVREVMLDDLDPDELHKEVQSLRGMMSFIQDQLRDIQLLFKSSKQRRKSIKVVDLVEKVERIYRRLLKTESIDLTIEKTCTPLVAKTTDAVLLQLLLNLFDNAVYWLKQTSIKDKKIVVTLDGDRGCLIFSDNGPGISADDAPYVFESFYSGKGEEGRGLGLYIARQLLARHDYSIEIAEVKSEKILPGANFLVSFVAEEE